MEYLFPRGAFHYSDYDVLKRGNKALYQTRFCLGENLKTDEIKFGSIISDLLEKDPTNELVADIPRLSHPEFMLTKVIDGVLIETHPDSFDPETLTFYEYKTANADKKVNRWTQAKVLKHEQLVFYAWMTWEIYGEYNPECYLIEIPTTKKKPSFIGYGSDELPISRNKIDGVYEKTKTFPREITMTEIMVMREKALKAAREASAIYKEWLLENNDII